LYSTYYQFKNEYCDGSIIGSPLAGYDLLIVDSAMHLLPVGIPGELIVMGEGVARGYLNRPEQNGQKFIIFGGRKAYRTGDLVRWSEDGFIEYFGRLDGQVKLRGLRIELGEVETAIFKYKGINSVCVTVKEIGGTQHLCAYYTAEKQLNESKIKSFLQHSLAEFMIPDAFVRLDKIPLTPNGKINKKELPIPNINAQTEKVQPEDVKEQVLFNIVCELLGRKDFGVTDDLKSIGLTSLLAIKLTAMANNLGLDIKASDVIHENSIRKILNGEKHVCYWVKPYKPEKPIVVLFYFLTPYNLLVPLRDKLTERFSVLMVESISDHFDYLFRGEDLNEVIEMYAMLIDLFLKSTHKIHAFVGHCLAGEVAFRLSALWESRTGDSVPVVMMNTNGFDYHRNGKYNNLINCYPERFKKKHRVEIKIKLRDAEIVKSLMIDNNPSVYNGKVIYYKATQKTPIPLEKELIKDKEFDFLKNTQLDDLMPKDGFVKYWQQFAPNLKCREIDAEHFTMLDEKYVDRYVNDISNL
jgi:hypothetical protein